MFCSNCGNQIQTHNKFCPLCGVQQSTGTHPITNESSTQTKSLYTDQELSIFVGKQSIVYLEKWKNNSRWNWSAFIFDFYWLLYRKMNLYAFLYIPFSLLIVTLPTVIIANEFEPEQALSTPLYVALFLFISLKVIIAIFSDSLYAYHSKNKIKELDSRHHDKLIQQQKIKQAGGTNIALPIVLSALPLFLSVVLIIFASVQLFDVIVKNDDSVTTQSVKFITDQQTTTTPTSYHVVLKDITTNLATKNKIIVIGLSFELDNQNAVTEFQDLEVKVKSIINQTLAELTVEQVTGSVGQDALTTMLMNKINAVMMEGEITQINIPNIFTE